MTALQILKKVRSEMRPNAKVGEYDLPVILKAMHDFAALRQPPVSGSLPSKDEAVNVGFKKATNADYNFRKVCRDPDHDLYYSGWMDCYDWLSGNDRLGKWHADDDPKDYPAQVEAWVQQQMQEKRFELTIPSMIHGGCNVCKAFTPEQVGNMYICDNCGTQVP